MSDPTKMAANYNDKVTAERTAEQVTPQLSAIHNNAANVMVEINAMEQQVRAVCNAGSVPTIQYPFFLCFGRELWALKRKGIAGASFAAECALLIAKWVARGLPQPVLESIRTEVFDAAAPVAP